MRLFFSTAGYVGVRNLCATCTAVALVLVGSRWIFVAQDKAGSYLCKVVPSSTFPHPGYEHHLNIDASDLAPCDRSAIDQVQAGQNHYFKTRKPAPVWIPEHEFHWSHKGLTDLQQVADRYAAFCRSNFPEDIREQVGGRCPRSTLWKVFWDDFTAKEAWQEYWRDVRDQR